MATNLSESTRRLGIWLPPAFFFGFSLLVFAGSPSGGSRIFYGALSGLTGLWLWRSWGVGVDMTDEVLVIRGQTRNHRLAWTDVRAATVAPMRTASPFQRVVPFVALTIELGDGRTVQYEEVSAASRRASLVQRVADEVNERLTGA